MVNSSGETIGIAFIAYAEDTSAVLEVHKCHIHPNIKWVSLILKKRSNYSPPANNQIIIIIKIILPVVLWKDSGALFIQMISDLYLNLALGSFSTVLLWLINPS